jgi:hypothetical protein
MYTNYNDFFSYHSIRRITRSSTMQYARGSLYSLQNVRESFAVVEYVPRFVWIPIRYSQSSKTLTERGKNDVVYAVTLERSECFDQFEDDEFKSNNFYNESIIFGTMV